MKRYENNKCFCPFVSNPSLDCYCFNLTSVTINQALYYCRDNFKRCEVYMNNSREQLPVAKQREMKKGIEAS